MPSPIDMLHLTRGASSGEMPVSIMENSNLSGGTGQKLTSATIIVAGVAALVATIASLVSIWLQTKNYRKPLLQRYVIRILLMVPIYAISSWSSMISLKVAFWVDPIRDVYEAFTIYTFFQLLINFIGGERALIIMMHGREPVHHLWPLNHCFPQVDISDPHSFLAIKRGILQYAWLKPVLGLATIIMKSTGIYKEGYIGVTSGYLWSGIVYNISVSLSLYSLGMFWVCMSADLQPFRPMPKFLCIKLIIFASYWQGFMLSILVFLNVIPDNVQGYTSDNLAAAIQDAMICCEMPLFAIAHWYAFSWHDYADVTISSARMPVWFAIRDAFGIRDLIEDTKETFSGNNYEYRLFDSGDNVLAHQGSSSRTARMMEGMRYERGGKGKYWLPKPGAVNAQTPLLSDQNNDKSREASVSRKSSKYSHDSGLNDDEDVLEEEEERLYQRAKRLEFGDWNYPVVTAHIPSRERWLHADPELITTSTNRNLLQPTKKSKGRRKSNIQKTIQETRDKMPKKEKGKSKGADGETQADDEAGRAPFLSGLLRHHSSGSSSAKSDRSQLVDLVVEDTNAEETERVRARKEGSAAWNTVQPKRFIKTYGENEGEDVREGYEPTDDPSVVNPKPPQDEEFAIGEDDDVESPGAEESRHWAEVNTSNLSLPAKYGVEGEDLSNVWAGPEPSSPPKENP